MEKSASRAARERLNAMLTNEGIANEGVNTSGTKVQRLTFAAFWRVWKKFVLDQSSQSDKSLLFCLECIAPDEEYDKLCFCFVVQFSVTRTNAGYAPLEQMGCNLYYHEAGSVSTKRVLSSEGFLFRSDDFSSILDFFDAIENERDIKKMFPLSASEMTFWDTKP